MNAAVDYFLAEGFSSKSQRPILKLHDDKAKHTKCNSLRRGEGMTMTYKYGGSFAKSWCSGVDKLLCYIRIAIRHIRLQIAITFTTKIYLSSCKK